MNRKRAGLVAVVVAGALVATAGATALAKGGNGASNKRPGYTPSSSTSSSGLSLLDGAVKVGHTGSKGGTDERAASGEAWASVLEIDVVDLPPELAPAAAGCTANAPADGSPNDTRSGGIAVPPGGGPVSVALFPSSCRAHAVKTNNGHGSAWAALLALFVDLPEHGHAIEVRALESRSDSRTTSGQANASSSFNLVSVYDGGNSVASVPLCAADAAASKQTPDNEGSDGLVVPFPDEVDVPGAPETIVAVGCSADAEHKRTDP